MEELKKEVDALKQKRVGQTDYLPDSIKGKHVGGGVRYIQTGLAANRPTTPAEPPNSCMIWFSYDSNVLSVWNISSNSWVNETLT